MLPAVLPSLKEPAEHFRALFSVSRKAVNTMTASMRPHRPSPEVVQRASKLEVEILEFARDVERLASGAYRRAGRASEACLEARRLVDDAETARYFSLIERERAALEVEEQRRFSEAVDELRAWIERTKEERAAHRLHPLDR